MKLLLDTHILLWALSDDPKLPEKAKKLILDPANELYYSTISVWEVELKRLAHPDQMPLTASALVEYTELAGYRQITLKTSHICQLASLQREESAPIHKDPFDRILICQAMTENMLFLTHYPLLAGYQEPAVCIV